MYSLETLPRITERIAWVTLGNSGYCNYIKNFCKSMERAGCTFKLIVFCIDAELAESLKDVKNAVCVDADPCFPTKLKADLCTWGLDDYLRIVFGKIDVMRYAMNALSYVPFIGYIDTDIVLFKDPSAAALAVFDTDASVQIVGQCGDPHPHCSKRDKCPELCSGVLVYRNNPSLASMLTYTAADVAANPNGDQVYLTDLFNKNGIRTQTIDKNVWINGGSYGPVYNSAYVIQDHAELLHFNYLVGNEKMAQMKRLGMWFI